jgi:hypothetical protein
VPRWLNGTVHQIANPGIVPADPVGGFGVHRGAVIDVGIAGVEFARL